MGHGKRDGSIRTFWPDDTDEVMHIDANVFSANTSLKELLERAQEKWPDISLDQIQISAAHVHTDCLGYDLYDPNDYTDFIVLRRNV